MIRNIQLNHGGKYVCVIETDVESLSTSAILVVKGKRVNLTQEFVFVHCVNLLKGCGIDVSVGGFKG